MHRRTIVLLPALLSSLSTTSLALTLPPLTILTPQNQTISPTLPLTALTALPPPQCHHIPFRPPAPRLSNSKCAFLIDDFCFDLVFYRAKAHDRWIWSEVSGCALGYYFPTGAEPPDWVNVCELIYSHLREKCAVGDAGYNAGSVNVGGLPGGGRGDGTGLVGGEGRYMIAPIKLTE